MAETRTAGVGLYLPAYLSGCLQGYAIAQRRTIASIVEEWLLALPERLPELAAMTPDLPRPSTGQKRVLVNVTPEARRRLNESAAALGRALGDETITARRLSRWLVEERLQALGEL